MIHPKGGVPIKIFTRQVEEHAREQLENVARLPFVFSHIAAMPDVHSGMGATIGSVIPTKGAVIPAAVGVDIGCGVMARPLDIPREALGSDISGLREEIEATIPHGRTHNGGPEDSGAWKKVPAEIEKYWRNNSLERSIPMVLKRHPRLINKRVNSLRHLGTLGSGNHFIEICLDENEQVWVMLHSGSRGVGNRIGTYFIDIAKKEMKRDKVHLPDPNLAFFKEGSVLFADYLKGVQWAQNFARANRRFMMDATLRTIQKVLGRKVRPLNKGIDCHHNYLELENHFKSELWITRKGAIRAGKGEMGIIPGSMGTRSYIVEGKGSRESFCSSAHGAGRIMSRREAKRRFSVADLEAQTQGIDCRKDGGVLDEIPGAYKDIDEVMANQSDLVEVVHTLKQMMCIKG
ncbi:MAG: RtcB family protein [Magnetococcales bacterium]|nr:RtcB family protein [Magnetococcales bacterium]